MQKLLAPILVGTFAFVGYTPPAECHKNHCHGATIKRCGGGWKRYKEMRTFVGPVANTSSESCDAAVDDFEEKLSVEAQSKCPELHPCPTCPAACNGCNNENSTGQIFDEKSKTPQRLKNGKYKCTVKAEIAFRCSCGGCIKKGH